MNGPPGSGGGGGSPGRHRHRTSTRLLLFAGSSWGRIGATFFVTIFLTKLLFEHLGLELAGLHFLFAFMTRFLTPLRGALAREMTREEAGALARDWRISEGQRAQVERATDRLKERIKDWSG